MTAAQVCTQVCAFTTHTTTFARLFSCLPVRRGALSKISATFGKVKVIEDSLCVCLHVCVRETVGGGGAVTLATQLHILQRLPQRKNVFLQHAITTDYRLPSLHQKLSPEKEKHCAFVCICVCVCVSLHTNRQRHGDKERWEMIIAHTKNHNWKKIGELTYLWVSFRFKSYTDLLG